MIFLRFSAQRVPAGWFSQLIASVVAPSGFGEMRAWSNVTSEKER